jgi:hypothetical protein
MSTKPKVIIKHIIAVLNVPRTIGDKIIKAQFIQSKLTGNANFTVPYPANIVTLVQLGLDITALVNAQTAVQNKAPGASDARNAALNTVLADLRNMMTMVQSKADSSPANSETIIQGAGYDVKQTAIKQKQQNAAKNTNVSGTALITADATGAHEWQQSKDQIAIITLPSTSTAHTLVSGLIPGNIWFFRNRKIAKKGQAFDWSDWMKLMIT